MELEPLDEQELRLFIRQCEAAHHRQQVVFSTYHEALTQVCFTCRAVRTSLPDP
jgi:hypothetical protein